MNVDSRLFLNVTAVFSKSSRNLRKFRILELRNELTQFLMLLNRSYEPHPRPNLGHGNSIATVDKTYYVLQQMEKDG